MGSCFSSPSTTQRPITEKQGQQILKKQPSYKRTANSVKKANKSQGHSLTDGDAEMALKKEEDARKAAGDAALKRLQEEKAKNGKLGAKLEKQRIQSTQQALNDKARQNLEQRKNEPLVYD